LGRALLRLKSATVIVFCPRAHLMPETRASGRMFLCICRQAELQKAGRPAFCLRRQTPASGPLAETLAVGVSFPLGTLRAGKHRQVRLRHAAHRGSRGPVWGTLPR